MREEIPVPIQTLPEYGLRLQSQRGWALHRFPDVASSDSTGAVPACVANGDSGVTISDDPADYFRAKLDLTVRSRRYSLCSRPSCFGRLKAVDGVTWEKAAAGNRSVADAGRSADAD
jgi:hypothetical protein